MRHAPRAAFSLIELLVVVGILALLVALLASVLAPARASADDAVCAANLRQCHNVSAAYALDHDGLGPAIGQPYASPPNWALLVQEASGAGGYRERSALVCPAADRALGGAMTRTYAMSAVGHNRREWNADPDRYDEPVPPGGPHVGVRFFRVGSPAGAPLLIDADRNAQQPPLPADRCASVVDFRPEAAMADRIGRWHGPRSARVFQAALLDGGVARFADPPASSLDPLP